MRGKEGRGKRERVNGERNRSESKGRESKGRESKGKGLTRMDYSLLHNLLVLHQGSVPLV